MPASHRLPRFASAIIGLVAILLLMTACGEKTGSSDEIAGDRLLSTATDPGLLPTPTLALPEDAGSVLRPPTPIILSSPTVDSRAEARPEASATPEPTDVVVIAAAALELPANASAEELSALGSEALAEGDFVLAATAFDRATKSGAELDARQLAEAQLNRGIALVESGQPADAVDVLDALADSSDPPADGNNGSSVTPVVIPDVAAFYLARAHATLGDQAGAIAAYEGYLRSNPDMAAYVQPLIADAYLALGNGDAALAALEGALSGHAQRFKAVENRFRLASAYLDRGDYAKAIAQYDAIYDLARTETTKGQVTYLAGQAEISAGNPDAGHERFLFAITNHPRATESYQALIALIDAGIPVDEYQRGVVDYYAGAYLPAIDAFHRHLEANPEGYQADTRLFLARTYEALGNREAALAELALYAADDPAAALFERAELHVRAGDPESALADYDAYLADFSESERAPGVAAAAATLADQLSRDDTAERYLYLADTFPFDPQTPAALYRAGELYDAAGDDAASIRVWQRLGEQYPANEYGADALFRLYQIAGNRAGAGVDRNQVAQQIRALPLSNYFALRARDTVDGIAPFTAEGTLVLPEDDSDDQALAEAWLRTQLTSRGVSVPDGSLAPLSAELAADARLQVGEKLWQVGLFEAAKAELETLREDSAGDLLATYQLALYFRDLGLYRSSVIAAAALLQALETTVYDAPGFLGRLSFPAYYADLILRLAEQYGYDPRLQLALVRQESLFESFARSGAAAQGLSQVIPDTGAWIAQRLAWPDFENEDLYKPYVGLNFGAYYLSEQLKNFHGHVHAALAAYNAGPGNASRWYEVAADDHDRYVDTVDFAETRLYIERIYEGYAAYRHLYSER